MIAKIKQIICISLVLFTFSAQAQKLVLAGERTDVYLHHLQNKKVGVVGNQTSMITNTHLVDSLISLGIDLVKVFSPEHGFRGKEDAGAIIEDGIDSKTGIPIFSLHGKNKKPQAEQLQGIDVLVFDIQDVGVRFYTYISTLHYVMEAAAEFGIPVLILDRPNPNGHFVDGPILDTAFQSFVGMHTIPIAHGMTIGEYAKMINGEDWITTKCELIVIEMENYNHESNYDLPIKPSPNLPNARAVNLYPSLCFFEGTNISVGRGTDYPFQQFGSPYLESNYSFTPNIGEGNRNPKHENTECFGTDLRFQKNYLTTINLNWIIETYKQCPEKGYFFNSYFDALAGNAKLKKQIIAGKTAEEIKGSWKEGLAIFNKTRRKYLIY